jgi:hypothetical protein
MLTSHSHLCDIFPPNNLKVLVVGRCVSARFRVEIQVTEPPRKSQLILNHQTRRGACDGESCKHSKAKQGPCLVMPVISNLNKFIAMAVTGTRAMVNTELQYECANSSPVWKHRALVPHKSSIPSSHPFLPGFASFWQAVPNALYGLNQRRCESSIANDCSLDIRYRA